MRSGKYPPIPGAYTGDLRALLGALLQRDPDARPSAADVLDLVFVRAHLRKHALRSRPVTSPAGAASRNGRVRERPTPAADAPPAVRRADSAHVSAGLQAPECSQQLQSV